jgi:hypothetical protein
MYTDGGRRPMSVTVSNYCVGKDNHRLLSRYFVSNVCRRAYLTSRLKLDTRGIEVPSPLSLASFECSQTTKAAHCNPIRIHREFITHFTETKRICHIQYTFLTLDMHFVTASRIRTTAYDKRVNNMCWYNYTCTCPVYTIEYI